MHTSKIANQVTAYKGIFKIAARCGKLLVRYLTRLLTYNECTTNIVNVHRSCSHGLSFI